MKFRKTTIADIADIMQIIAQAQAYLKSQGIDQWQNNYPNPDTIRNDIDNDNSYVLEMDGLIVGTAAIVFTGDRNYDVIYDGEWLSCGEYAAIHRIAVAAEYKGSGLASVIIKDVEHMCADRNIHSIRVDTHEKNTSMQRLLQKNDFQYCGIIYLEDGSKRIAFEKII